MMAEMASFPTQGLSPEQLEEEQLIFRFAAYAILALFALIFALLTWAWALIAFRASNIARWLYTIWAAFSVISWPFGLSEMNALRIALSGVSIVLTVIAIYLLHRPAAREWFRASGNPVDPETFR